MNNKITIQDLCMTLSSKLGTTRKDADAFVRQFFDVIYEGVLRDKIVKVKGLGTFKLVEVNDRESVNVNTGERIRIPGHSKVSFTPDPTLRDRINKPFADFPTVIINDETPLSEMERMSDTLLDEQPATVEAQDEEVNVEPLIVETPEVDEVEQTNAPIAVEESESDNKPVIVPVHEVEQQPVAVLEENDQPDSIEISSVADDVNDAPPISHIDDTSAGSADAGKGSKPCSCWCRLLWVVLVLILLAGSYVAGYLHVVSVKPLDDMLAKKATCEQPDGEAVLEVSTPVVPVPSEPSDTLSNEEPLVSVPDDSIQMAKAELQNVAPQPVQPQPKPAPAPRPAPEPRILPAPDPAAQAATMEQAAMYDQVPGGDYLIVGTRRVHKMQYGDYVTKLARQEYGSKDFVPYIIVHNHLVDADNVVIGAELKLPELRAK